MNKLLKYTLVACMSMICGASMAQAEGAYAGVGLGLFQLDPGQNQKSALGGNVNAGIELGPLLAIEGRFGGSQSVTSKGETMKADWLFSVLAKPKYAVAGNFNIYGLAGATMMKTTFVSAAAKKQAKTSSGLSYGAGGEFYVSYNTLVGAEWVRYSTRADGAVKNISFQGLDVSAYLITLQMNF